MGAQTHVSSQYLYAIALNYIARNQPVGIKTSSYVCKKCTNTHEYTTYTRTTAIRFRYVTHATHSPLYTLLVIEMDIMQTCTCITIAYMYSMYVFVYDRIYTGFHVRARPGSATNVLYTHFYTHIELRPHTSN